MSDFNLELLTAFGIFSFVSSITPGPNNLMLMSSGANFGIKRTLPHMFGVCIGFTLMVALVGIGLIEVFAAFPVFYDVLKIVSVLYLLYLAYKIARSSEPIKSVSGNEQQPTPISFLQAASFQWVNPKAWSMALTAVTVYSPSNTLSSIVIIAAIFGLINFPCINCWVYLGKQLRRFLNTPKRLTAFNYSMAGLLVLSLYPVLF